MIINTLAARQHIHNTDTDIRKQAKKQYAKINENQLTTGLAQCDWLIVQSTLQPVDYIMVVVSNVCLCEELDAQRFALSEIMSEPRRMANGTGQPVAGAGGLCFIYTEMQLTGNLIQFYRLTKSCLLFIRVKRFNRLKNLNLRTEIIVSSRDSIPTQWRNIACGWLSFIYCDQYCQRSLVREDPSC